MTLKERSKFMIFIKMASHIPRVLDSLLKLHFSMATTELCLKGKGNILDFIKFLKETLLRLSLLHILWLASYTEVLKHVSQELKCRPFEWILLPTFQHNLVNI